MNRETAIRRVRSLMRLADSTTFPEEAKSARRKAGYLMAQHRLVFEKDVAPSPAPPRPAPQPSPVPAGIEVPPEYGFGYGWSINITASNSTNSGTSSVIYVVRAVRAS